MTNTDMLWQVTAPHFCAGLVTQNDWVVDAAPILWWTIGLHRGDLREYFQRKHWRAVQVT